MFRQLSASEQEAVRQAVTESPLLSGIAAEPTASARFEEILAQYVRPVRFDAGQVVCREGDYGSVLYFVLEGSLRVVVEDREGAMTLSDPPSLVSIGPKRRFWNFWKAPEEEEIFVVDASVRQTLANMDEVLESCDTVRLEPSSADDVIAGAFAVLTRSAFQRTVFAETPVRLLAVHWRGMRDLTALSDPARRSINAHCLAEIVDLVRSGAFAVPVFSPLPRDALTVLMETADFRFAGGPSSGFTALRQGEPVREVFVVVSGFGRVRHLSAGRSHSVGFVRRGDVFGLAALAAGGQGSASKTSLEFLGDTSLLVLPGTVLMEDCLPFLSREDIARSDPAAPVELGDPDTVTSAALRDRSREASLIDFLVDNAFVRGRQAMVIDQTRCVGCDACVQGCADTHGGVPRFVRQGPAKGGYSVANACMHCEEAPCLVNCPTEAVFRKFSGEVVVSEVLCIGCGTCTAACPYDNIRLVEMGLNAEAKERSIPVATKCDLCIGQETGPACVRACPHDAIARVDLTDHELVGRLAAGAPLRTVRSKGR